MISDCFVIQIIFSKKMDTTNWHFEFCHVRFDLDELCAGADILIKLHSWKSIILELNPGIF